MAMGYLSSQATEAVLSALCLTNKCDFGVSGDRMIQAAMGDMVMGYLLSQAAEGVRSALCLTNK